VQRSDQLVPAGGLVIPSARIVRFIEQGTWRGGASMLAVIAAGGLVVRPSKERSRHVAAKALRMSCAISQFLPVVFKEPGPIARSIGIHTTLPC
jgi:hypothetical protein